VGHHLFQEIGVNPEAIGTILIVCTGNICRSPMAEGVLRDRFRSSGMDHIRLESAGIHGWDSQRPTLQAVQACRGIGVDIGDLRSSPINRQMVEAAALILAMERHHIEKIQEWFNVESAKLHLLGEFYPENPGMEIPDPYGLSTAYYRKILDLICRCANGLVRQLTT